MSEETAEGLAAMAGVAALIALLLKKGLVTADEMAAAVDSVQLDLERKFPHRRDQKKAVRILESVLKGLSDRKKAGD